MPIISVVYQNYGYRTIQPIIFIAKTFCTRTHLLNHTYRHERTDHRRMLHCVYMLLSCQLHFHTFSHAMQAHLPMHTSAPYILTQSRYLQSSLGIKHWWLFWRKQLSLPYSIVFGDPIAWYVGPWPLPFTCTLQCSCMNLFTHTRTCMHTRTYTCAFLDMQSQFMN